MLDCAYSSSQCGFPTAGKSIRRKIILSEISQCVFCGCFRGESNENWEPMDRSDERLSDFVSYLYVYFLLFSQPDSVVEAAVEKINSLLESFMGINDSDLGIIIDLYVYSCNVDDEIDTITIFI